MRNVEAHSADIVSKTTEKFGLSRVSVNGYMRRIIDQGLVEAAGRTYARRYSLKRIGFNTARIELSRTTAEHEVWKAEIEPHLKELPANVSNICQYGFTEIFNNVIDHSQSESAIISYDQTYTSVHMMILDQGVGIFEKLQKDFKYEDPRTALLELSKGKLTTDPAKHSGEGIFFTSRMFDSFNLISGHLGYRRIKEDDWGWLVETDDIANYRKGTIVAMHISTNANWTAAEVFERYEGEDRSFAKTHVPIKLGKYGSEQLVSRSQAKRILARFDRFSEVFLDFQGVDQIGQGFADEMFRVFKASHPDIDFTVINAGPEVVRMIAHVSVPSTASTRPEQGN